MDAYRFLYDGLTFALLGALLTGLVLIIRRRGFLASYVSCLCGAVIALGEFLVR